MTGTADRSRRQIPLDRAIELLRRIYAEKEAADRANHLETRQVHENNAYALWRELTAGTPILDLQARRNAAAAISRTMIEPEAWDEVTVEAGHSAIDPAALNSPTGAMQGRNVVCRMLLDYSELLPPGLAHEMAVALYLTTLGERDTWLTRSPRVGGVAHHVAIAEIGRVYYDAGFFAYDLALAAEKLFPADPSRWAALEKFRTRNSDLQADFDQCKAAGAADRADGRRYSVPLAATYTVDQLEALRPRKKARKAR